MACCAFVAFLVSQIYLMIQGLSRWLRGSRDAPVPSAVMWRLEQPVTQSFAEPSNAVAVSALPRPRYGQSRSRALLSVVLVAEITVLIGGAQWFMDGGARSLLIDAQRLASVRSWTDLKIICTTKR